jgi:hypothetical protein
MATAYLDGRLWELYRLCTPLPPWGRGTRARMDDSITFRAVMDGTGRVGHRRPPPCALHPRNRALGRSLWLLSLSAGGFGSLVLNRSLFAN